jgi:hypothetical protein
MAQKEPLSGSNAAKLAIKAESAQAHELITQSGSTVKVLREAPEKLAAILGGIRDPRFDKTTRLAELLHRDEEIRYGSLWLRDL